MSTDDENISGLYHSADKPGPSKTLDEAILTASRDAVEKPTRTKAPFAGGWPAAASIAAVIVITIILVPILKQEQSQQTWPQTEPGRTSVLPEEAVPGAYRATEVKKKAMDTATPASAPAMLLKDSPVAEDRAMPEPDGLGSGAALQPVTGESLDYEKEEGLLQRAAPGSKRSRMQASDSAPFAIHTPEMWQVKISQLIAHGKLEQARNEVEKLKQHYPDYSIDPSILEKLK